MSIASDDRTTLFPATALDAIVDAAITTFPDLAYKATAKDGPANRAEAAADIVRRHQCKYIGQEYGADWWSCGQYRVSIQDGSCQCQDSAAPHDSLGRLCKHRLAAMFMIKLENGHMARLVELLEGCPSDKIVLSIDVLFGDRSNTYTVNGHRYDGSRWVEMAHADRFPVTLPMFNAAARVTGWVIGERPVKQKGFVHYFTMVRVGIGNSDGASWSLDSMTGATIDRLEAGDRMRTIVADQVEPIAPANQLLALVAPDYIAPAASILAQRSGDYAAEIGNVDLPSSPANYNQWGLLPEYGAKRIQFQIEFDLGS